MLLRLNLHLHFKLGRASFELNALSQWEDYILYVLPNRFSVSLKIKSNSECIVSDFGVFVFERKSASVGFKN